MATDITATSYIRNNIDLAKPVKNDDAGADVKADDTGKDISGDGVTTTDAAKATAAIFNKDYDAYVSENAPEGHSPVMALKQENAADISRLHEATQEWEKSVDAQRFTSEDGETPEFTGNFYDDKRLVSAFDGEGDDREALTAYFKAQENHGDNSSALVMMDMTGTGNKFLDRALMYKDTNGSETIFNFEDDVYEEELAAYMHAKDINDISEVNQSDVLARVLERSIGYMPDDMMDALKDSEGTDSGNFFVAKDNEDASRLDLEENKDYTITGDGGKKSTIRYSERAINEGDIMGAWVNVNAETGEIGKTFDFTGAKSQEVREGIKADTPTRDTSDKKDLFNALGQARLNGLDSKRQDKVNDLIAQLKFELADFEGKEGVELDEKHDLLNKIYTSLVSKPPNEKLKVDQFIKSLLNGGYLDIFTRNYYSDIDALLKE